MATPYNEIISGLKALCAHLIADNVHSSMAGGTVRWMSLQERLKRLPVHLFAAYLVSKNLAPVIIYALAVQFSISEENSTTVVYFALGMIGMSLVSKAEHAMLIAIQFLEKITGTGSKK